MNVPREREDVKREDVKGKTQVCRYADLWHLEFSRVSYFPKAPEAW